MIPKDDLLSVKTLKFKDEACLKNTLGMTWNSQSDCFQFNCSCLNENPEKLTHRIILSVYSRIFDRLGFIQQFILQPKLLIQKLNRLGLSWDEEVPPNIKKERNVWLTGINAILNFEFP